MDNMHLRIMWMKIVAFFLLTIVLGFVAQDIFTYG